MATPGIRASLFDLIVVCSLLTGIIVCAIYMMSVCLAGHP
jgi:hypothetical protein